MEGDDAADLLERLAAAVGAANVDLRPAERSAYAADGLRAGRSALAALSPPAEPLAVVRPGAAAEVAAVLRLAAAAGRAVVPYGGGTGLMGGARSVRPGIVLDMARMNRVLEISREDRTARAEAGTVIADLNAALAPHGLVCGHDPWTVPIATLGGAISTNGLGYLGGRYGSIGDQVLGLEVVLADGTVVRTRPAERSATGPHLRRLWTGAEGTLGVITEVTLRVFPLPEARALRAFTFATFAEGFAAICAMAAIGLRPAMIDYGGPPDAHDVSRLYLAFEGFAEEVEAAARRADGICRTHGGAEQDGAEARRFFADRHVDPSRLRGWRRSESHDPAPGTPGSGVFDYLHVYLPQSRVLEFLTGATARLGAADLDVVEWGLWNQPELVSLALRAETETPAALDRLRAAEDAVVRLCQDLGGSMEYVHGIGLRLAHLAERELGAGLDVLRRIKSALDPDYVLNPAKLGL